MNPAEILVVAAEIYLGAGLMFAVWFVSRGVVRVDESTAGAGILFRLLLIPGTAALWPWLARRVFGGRSSDDSVAQKKA